MWSILVAIALGLFYILPGSFVFALTSQQISVNLIIELIGGYIIPGLPLANMVRRFPPSVLTRPSC